jgi:alpha,alpha-trehalase
MLVKIILSLLILFLLGLSNGIGQNKENGFNTIDSIKQVYIFIQQNWTKTIRVSLADTEEIIGLPKPYSVPSVEGRFIEMYYWDTYYTNLGLIRQGFLNQAINNVECIASLIERYGFMPNGNAKHYLTNSQPPHFSMMVRDIYEITRDKIWLKKVLPTILKEYNFWMTQRLTKTGLNRYYNQAQDQRLLNTFRNAGKRLGSSFDTLSYNTRDQKLRAGSNLFSEYESGWDFNPRFNNSCNDFLPVDLNSFLYMYEINFSLFYSELGIRPDKNWQSVAQKRKQLINKFLFNKKKGLFYDYNYMENAQSHIYSSAVFSILWANIATKKQAAQIVKNLYRLECDFGIAACEKGVRKYKYQWDYPNGWPNLQYAAIIGLNNYYFFEEGERIAGKYVNTVLRNYGLTKNLWEKYNVTDGSINVSNEYVMPTMMGWSAGVFVFAYEYCKH